MCTTAPRRERGAVILLLLLVVVSASAFVVLKALNEAAAREVRQRFDSVDALGTAKRALIGYAVAYADGTHALGKGPGHLPCPDHDAAGTVGSSDAVPDCTAASDNETGRFPWRTLGLPELLDGSGAPLWYAVSDNFRSTASPPLNSDTPGTLSVDGRADVVAVVIAPGGPLASQSRTAANRYDPAAWLEAANASTGDGAFASAAPGAFNDVVMTITRAELMAAVELTVVTEVANALDGYFTDPDGDDVAAADPDCGADPDCDDGYPWLSDFTDPTSSSYAGAVDDLAGGDVPFGHLPLVRAGVAFAAGFGAAWNIPVSGTITDSGAAELPGDDCVRTSNCTQDFATLLIMGVPNFPQSFTFPGGVSGVPVGGWNPGSCTLDGPQNIVCTAAYDFTVTHATFGHTRSFRRTYTLTFVDNSAIDAPTGTALRMLRVAASGAWPGTASSITVTDAELPGGTEIGRKTLTFGALSAGESVLLTGVPFDLEVSDDALVDHTASPGELPNWFFANGWHRHVVVQYATAESPGDAALDCTADGTCLTLNVLRPGAAAASVAGGIRGLVIAVGADLSGARPSASLADYLESANATVDTTFDRFPASATFNDRLVTLPLERP